MSHKVLSNLASLGDDLKPPSHASLVLSEKDEGLLAWTQMSQVDLGS